MRVTTAIVALGVCASVLLAGGCGPPGGPKPPMGKVHGKVTYNGKPVTSGIVTFVPILGKGGETGQLASGGIESDGSFTLTTFNTGDGAILGQHAATVREDVNTPPPPSKGAITGAMPEFGGKNAGQVVKSALPAKYGTVESTPLKYTVEKGDNNYTLELKD